MKPPHSTKGICGYLASNYIFLVGESVFPKRLNYISLDIPQYPSISSKSKLGGVKLPSDGPDLNEALNYIQKWLLRDLVD